MRLGSLVLCAAIAAAAPLPPAADVLIIGGSSAGVGAAIGAARLGVQVVLVEDTPVLGGMLSNGICNIDSYSYESLSGVFEEFRLAVKDHYARTLPGDPFFAPTPRQSRHIDGRSFPAHEASEGGRWEPRVAAEIFRGMVAKYKNITTVYNAWATGVVMDGRRIAGVRVETASGERGVIAAKAVVDATHEGDIAAWAGAPYRIGREPRSPLEPHAGRIYYFNGTGEILPGSTGEQDRAIPSAGLRMTIQDYGEAGGHVLRTPPPGYDPENYRHAPSRLRTAMPRRKFEMNANPAGNELQEIVWEWPEAGRARRLALFERFKNHALGYLYYLQHEKGMTNYGLPADEFTDNGHVPYRIYLREGRRIEGEATLTEADVVPFITARGWLPPRRDSIGVGHYPIDAKPARTKTDFSRPDKGEGDFYLIDVTAPFTIPFGTMIPKRVEQLLVPVAVSATHVAFSALRMDPTWTALGQSAGIAAALSVQRNETVRRLPVEAVQQAALRQRVRIAFFWDLPLDHPAFEAMQTMAVRGVFQGYPDRTIRPDSPLTRAEAAAAIVRAAGLWPSVSDWHFEDVPVTHWAFREVETLFDNRALEAFGVKPRWTSAGPYDGDRSSGFAKPDSRATFEPDRPVSWPEWKALCRLVRPDAEAEAPNAQAGEGAVSRAAAAMSLAALMK